jgi:glycosyltransferase involved in cell wall biosynthesis
LNILWLAHSVDGATPQLWTSALASTRYRVILPARALADGGHAVSLSSVSDWLEGAPEASPSVDLIVVGKILPDGDGAGFADLTQRLLRRLVERQDNGCVVLADFCDDHFAHPGLGPCWRGLAQKSDLCVAATPEMAERVRRHARGPVHVVADPVAGDFQPPSLWQGTVLGNSRAAGLFRWVMPAARPLVLAWYGALNNWPAMQRWAERLPELQDQVNVRLDVVTQPDSGVQGFVADFNARHGGRVLIVFHPWSVAEQRRVVAAADVVLVPSRLDQGAKAVKSANRVSDALAAGKFVVATPLPAYRIYTGGVEFSDDPVQAIQHYLNDPQLARAMIEQGQALARQHFAPSVIGDLWRAALDAAWAGSDSTHRATRSAGGDAPTLRVAVLAVGAIPTYQLRFLLPWQAGASAGAVEHVLFSENDLLARFDADQAADAALFLREQLDSFRPSHLVFCRYAGAHSAMLLDWARARGVATVLHIDDDLLDPAASLKSGKQSFHADPARLAALRLLLSQVDLVLTAGQALVDRLRSQGVHNEMSALPLPCAAQIKQGPATSEPGGELRIGYMGSKDHAADLALVVPALVEVMDAHPEVVFELYGPLSLPTELEVFGARVRQIAPLFRYEDFLLQLVGRRWHIALCPLQSTPFNTVKTHIKWVEYSCTGAAVLASAGTIYDDCCAEGRGRLVETPAHWSAALHELIGDESARTSMVGRAQDHLRRHYRLSQLQRGLLDALEQADALRLGRHVQPVVTQAPGATSEAPAARHAPDHSAALPGYEMLHRQHDGKVSDKWSSYFGVYDRVLAPFRQQSVALLEIGVQNGGSLELWGSYFAQGRLFVGCDIEEACGKLRFADKRVRVVVGNANSEQTAVRIAEASPQFDIIIDDGSHLAHDIVQSFLRYFSWLRPGGVYIAEDVHTMYMHGYGGGLRSPTSAQEFFKLLVDIVNYQHWQGRLPLDDGVAAYAPGGRVPQFLLDGWVDRIEFENSFVVIHKARHAGHEKLGERVVSGTVADVRNAVLVYQQSQVD